MRTKETRILISSKPLSVRCPTFQYQPAWCEIFIASTVINKCALMVARVPFVGRLFMYVNSPLRLMDYGLSSFSNVINPHAGKNHCFVFSPSLWAEINSETFCKLFLPLAPNDIIINDSICANILSSTTNSKVRSLLKNNFLFSSLLLSSRLQFSICRCFSGTCVKLFRVVVICSRVHWRLSLAEWMLFSWSELISAMNLTNESALPFAILLHGAVKAWRSADEANLLAQTVNSAALHHRHLNTFKLILNKLLSFITQDRPHSRPHTLNFYSSFFFV